MEYVIIGNSTAAVGCIEGIRSVDPEGAITVVASEPYHTYSRPLISYFLEGKTDGEQMKYRPDSYYNEMAVKPKLGIKAVKLMPEEHKVVLEDGEELPYGKLLVATGSTPFVPSFEGLDTVEKKFTFLSLDDAKALEAALTPESRVLILGAGLIGLKCAEGIARRVKSIEVADLASQVLPSILDEAGAKQVQARLEGQGLTFHLGDTAVKFQGNTAHLKSGGTVDFDVLVLAVGVRPNGSLVREAGGKVDRGILTDDTGLTSLPDVYANAYLQGECAGKNMAGESFRFTNAVPMNAIGFFGLHLITAGSYRGEKLAAQDGDNYKAFFVENGLLKGFILIGDCLENAGVYTALIRERTPLSAVDFGLLREKPQFMAFSASKRRELFGR